MNTSYWSVVLVLSVCVSVCAAVPGGSPATAPADVAGLLRQLGDDDSAKRDTAQKELERIGPGVLPALRELVKSAADEEVRMRATGAIAKIESDQQFGQTRLTLDMIDAPADQVFAEIARQSLAPMPLEVSEAWRAAMPRLTVKASSQPFWEVLPPLCVKARVHPEWRAGGMVLAEGYNGELDGRAIFSGPFLVVLKSAQFITTLRPDGNAAGTQAEMTIHVFAEPKICVVDVPAMASVTEAIDSRDRAITPLDPMLEPGLGGVDPRLICPNDGFRTGVALEMDAETKGVKKLKCELNVLVSVRPKITQIDKPLAAKPVRGRMGGCVAVVGPMTRCKSHFILAVEGSGKEMADLVGDDQKIGRFIKVFDAKGRVLPFDGMMGGGDEGERKPFGLLFITGIGTGDPDKVVLLEHADTREIKIELEYKDIPLP